MGVVIWREGGGREGEGREGRGRKGGRKEGENRKKGEGREGRRRERGRRKGGKEGGEREGDNTQHATSKVDVLHSRIHTYTHFAYLHQNGRSIKYPTRGRCTQQFLNNRDRLNSD